MYLSSADTKDVPTLCLCLSCHHTKSRSLSASLNSHNNKTKDIVGAVSPLKTSGIPITTIKRMIFWAQLVYIQDLP
jgi:hypothetical protein